MATPTIEAQRCNSQTYQHTFARETIIARARLTSLQHLVTSLSDDMQPDDLLVLALADQLVRGRLLVLFLEHGKRHGLELSSRETDETI
jgi:hypothetical protein